MTWQAIEPFKAEGLHLAMYTIPALGALLALVLFAASRTVIKDMEKVQNWMREASAKPAPTKSATAEAAN